MLSAYALTALGRTDEAVAILQRFDDAAMPKLYTSYVSGIRLLLAGERTAARQRLQELVDEATMRDPCAWYYITRAAAYLGDVEGALTYFERSVRGGFFCFPWFARDAWLDPIRSTSQCRALLSEAHDRHRTAVEAFARAGGDRLLGVVLR